VNAMALEMFYQKLLNPPKPWMVSKVELSDDGSRVDVWLTHEEYTFLYSVCQEPAPTYGSYAGADIPAFGHV